LFIDNDHCVERGDPDPWDSGPVLELIRQKALRLVLRRGLRKRVRVRNDEGARLRVDGGGRVVDPTRGCRQPPLPAAMRGVVLPLDLVDLKAIAYSRGTLSDPASMSKLRESLGVPRA
jgi:hypothetical protein